MHRRRCGRENTTVGAKDGCNCRPALCDSSHALFREPGRPTFRALLQERRMEPVA